LLLALFLALAIIPATNLALGAPRITPLRLIPTAVTIPRLHFRKPPGRLRRLAAITVKPGIAIIVATTTTPIIRRLLAAIAVQSGIAIIVATPAAPIIRRLLAAIAV
jgi:hypothetical protein